MKTINKIFKTILIIVITLFLFNCSKDDDDNNIQQEPSTQELLIGKWLVTATSEGTASECTEQTFFDFEDNETLNYKFVGEFRDLSGELIGCDPIVNGNYPYTLSSNNSFSITTDEFGLQTFKIVTISETDLVLTQDTPSGLNIILLEKS